MEGTRGLQTSSAVCSQQCQECMSTFPSYLKAPLGLIFQEGPSSWSRRSA